MSHINIVNNPDRNIILLRDKEVFSPETELLVKDCYPYDLIAYQNDALNSIVIFTRANRLYVGGKHMMSFRSVVKKLYVSNCNVYVYTGDILSIYDITLKVQSTVFGVDQVFGTYPTPIILKDGFLRMCSVELCEAGSGKNIDVGSISCTKYIIVDGQLIINDLVEGSESQPTKFIRVGSSGSSLYLFSETDCYHLSNSESPFGFNYTCCIEPKHLFRNLSRITDILCTDRGIVLKIGDKYMPHGFHKKMANLIKNHRPALLVQKHYSGTILPTIWKLRKVGIPRPIIRIILMITGLVK
jgi:hypothetical protein